MLIKNTHISILMDQITKVLNDPQLLNTFYVINSNEESFSLNNDIEFLIKKLNIPIDKHEYENLNDQEIILFKLQLWLEEKIMQKVTLNEFNIKYDKIIKRLKVKFSHINIKNLIKIHHCFTDHNINIDAVIVIILTLLFSMKKSDKNIMSTNFIFKVAEQYVYRYVYYRFYLDSYSNFEEFKIGIGLKPSDLYKIGSYLIESFIELNYIKSEYISDDDIRGHVIIISSELLDLLNEYQYVDNLNIPMISKPLKWRLVHNQYVGGNYRSDISQLILVHKTGLYKHTIKSIDMIIKNINILQTIPLYINKDLLMYIVKNIDLDNK